jgi:hypothetical protein
MPKYARLDVSKGHTRILVMDRLDAVLTESVAPPSGEIGEER